MGSVMFNGLRGTQFFETVAIHLLGHRRCIPRQGKSAAILSPLILTVQKEQNRGFTLKFHLESSKQLSFATELSKKQGFSLSNVLPMPYPTKAVLFWTQAPAAQSLELYGVLRHDPDAARQSMQCGGQ